MKKKHKKIIIIGAILIGAFGLIWAGSVLENNNKKENGEVNINDLSEAEQSAVEQLLQKSKVGDDGAINIAGDDVDQAVIDALLEQLNAKDKEVKINDTDQLPIDTTTIMTNPIITLHTTKGDINIELFMDTMPITAGNFLKLAKEGFYDDIKFHRVIDGFMIQGGDPNTKGDDTATYGTGGPGYAISDEFVEGPSNVRGTISMANSGPNTGGSQFFINLADNTNLDFNKEPLTSKHPVFGKVVSNMNIVDEIGSVATGARDIPVEPVVIESVSIN